MKQLLALVCLVPSLLVAQSKLSAVWGLDDIERVQRENTSHWAKTSANNDVWKNGKINVFGVRNETVAFQLILETGAQNATSVSVELPYLQVQGGTARIDNSGWNGTDVYNYVGRRIEIFRAQYVYQPTRNSYWHVRSSAVPQPDAYYTGYLPDALVPVEAPSYGQPFGIAANNTQSMFFDVYIPKNQTPGVYLGTIAVKEAGVTTYSVPVELTVYNATLSDTTHHRLWMYGADVAGLMGYTTGDNNAFWEWQRKNWQFGHRHRIDVFNGGMYHTYANLLARFGGIFTGAAYTTGQGYDGPGIGIGNRTASIGTYERSMTTGRLYDRIVVEPCEATWTAGGSVTVTTETASGLFKRGTRSVKADVAAGASTGLLMYQNITAKNLNGRKYIDFYIRSTVATSTGDLQLVLDEGSGAGAPEVTIDVPALSANSWRQVLYKFPGGGTERDAIASVGLKMAVDKGAFVVYLDELNVMPNVNFSTSRVFGSTTEANYQTGVDQFETWFLANAPDVLRFKYVQDEPGSWDWDGDGYRLDADDIADTAYAYEGIRTMCTWMMNAPGPGKNLLRMITSGPDFSNRLDNGTGSNNYITFWTSPYAKSWGWSTLAGLNFRDDPPGVYMDGTQEDGDYDNVTRWHNTEHDSVGHYNLGWPATGSFGYFDAPLIVTRIFGWMLYKYRAFYCLEWNFETYDRFSTYQEDWTTWNSPRLLGTHLYPGKDVIHPAASFGLDGPVASMRFKATRRGIQDGEYLWKAEHTGKLVTSTMLDPVAPRGFDDFGGTYLNFGDVPFPLYGYTYDRTRKVIAQALDGTDAGGVITPMPTVDMTGETTREGAGSVALSWTATNAIGVDIRPSTDHTDEDTVVSLTGSSVNFWLDANTTYRIRAWNSTADTVTDNHFVTVTSGGGGTSEEKLTNGDFESATTGNWTFYENSSGSGTGTRETSPTPQHGTYLWRCVLPTPYDGSYPNVQTYNNTNFSLEAGAQYRLTYSIYGSASGSTRTRVLQNGGSYTGYGLAKTIAFGSSAWTRVAETFTASGFSGTVSDAYLQFLFALGTTAYTAAGTTVYIDSVSLVKLTPGEMGVPAISTPAQSAEVDTPVAVAWNAIAGATKYHVQVDGDIAFGSVDWESSTITATSTSVTGLSRGATYYVHVRAGNDAGWSSYSTTVAFSTAPGAPASAPTLLLPASNATAVSNAPTLSWSAVAGTLTYEVVITPVGEAGDTARTSVTSVTLSGGQYPQLGYSTQYNWKVRATNAAGEGAFSSERVFTTGSRVGLSSRKYLIVR